MLEWLLEPLEFGFIARALLGTTMIAILSALIGSFVVLKGLAFIGDAIAHAAFGGMAFALLVGLSLKAGAAMAAVVTAMGVIALGRTGRIKNDSALAILFTGAFSLGVLLLAWAPSFAGDLTSLLLGSVLAITSGDLWLIFAVLLLSALALGLTYRHLVYVSFDPIGAEAAGLPVVFLQSLLLLLMAGAIVVSLQAVGVILVVSLLITPASTAALFQRSLPRLMALAAFLGVTASWVGIYLSYYLAVPPGASIVLTATVFFGLGFAIQSLRPRLSWRVLKKVRVEK